MAPMKEIESPIKEVAIWLLLRRWLALASHSGSWPPIWDAGT